ncbi:MAG: hypothetical protein ACT4R6_13680 [Gemmatimonadaceae bacterium]
MDVLVMLDENLEHSTVLAHVNSVPSPLDSDRPTRDVVTLYGLPTVQSLALALAAAVESRRVQPSVAPGTIRHLGLWPDRGAVGDTAWRDVGSGRLVSRDLTIPLDRLQATAADLLSSAGPQFQRLVAGLTMSDWPEGTRRAISFSLTSPALAEASAGEMNGGGIGNEGAEGGEGGDGAGGRAAGSGRGAGDLLETYRYSAGLTYDNEGD